MGSGRTVIIASHAVEALAPIVSQAIFLEDGKAVWQGSGPELLKTEHMAHLKGLEGLALEVAPAESTQKSEDTNQFVLSVLSEEKFNFENAPVKTPKQLVLDEVQGVGSIQWKYWHKLLQSSGGLSFWLISMMLAFVAYSLAAVQRAVLE